MLQRNKANVLDSLPIVIFSCATYPPSDSQTVISQHHGIATGKVSLPLAPWGTQERISADADSLTPPTTVAPEVCLITCEAQILPGPRVWPACGRVDSVL